MTLTTQQLEAATAQEQCVLVQACPGSGKTTLLVARIKHLINSGFEPSRVVALMFNRTVRQQFVERLGADSTFPSRAVHVHTFHSFAYSVLVAQSPGQVANIGSPDDFMRVCHEIALDSTVRRFKGTINLTAAFVADQITRLSNGLYALGSQQDPQLNVSQLDQAIFELYKSKCSHQHIVFEADLLYLFVSLTESNSAMARQVSEYFDHVLIDEGQDMNWAQITVAMCLKNSETNFTVVFDYDQSIYGFLGAKPNFVSEQIVKHFPISRTYPLSITFRYGPVIAALSSKLMHSSANWSGQFTVSAQGLESHVKLLSPQSNPCSVAAQCIAAKIDAGLSPSDVAVLVRSYGQVHGIAMNLMLRNIPFRIDGAHPYFENHAIYGLCALLRVITEDSDRFDFSDYSSALEFMLPFLRPDQLKQTLEQTLATCVNLSPTWSRRIHYAFQTLQKRRHPAFKPMPLIREVTKSMGIWGALDPQVPSSNCVDSMRCLRSFIQIIESLDLTIEQALEFIEKSSQVGQAPLDQAAVTLTSIHKAKGLEWDYVLLPEIQKGAYSDPLTQSVSAFEEERRLLYVAMTRAKSHLVLMFPNDGQLMRELGFKTNLPPIASAHTSPYLKQMQLRSTLTFGAKLQRGADQIEIDSSDPFQCAYIHATKSISAQG